MNKVEVRQFKKMDYLPFVFLTPDLNKFSLTTAFVNCAKYSSRSGLTQEGCLEIGNEVREVRGIYFAPIEPIFKIETRRKSIKEATDIMNILQTVDFKNIIGNMGVKKGKLLAKWDNYSISIYDKYYKGMRYQFPIIAQQGHLNVYEVPPMKDAFNISEENNENTINLDKERFEEINKFDIYNHHVTFSKPVFRYKQLFVTPGRAELIYLPTFTEFTVYSPDHDHVRMTIAGNTWLLFTHSRPNLGKVD